MNTLNIVIPQLGNVQYELSLVLIFLFVLLPLSWLGMRCLKDIEKKKNTKYLKDETRYRKEGKPDGMSHPEWLEERVSRWYGKPSDIPVGIWKEAQNEVAKEDKRAIAALNKSAKQLAKQAAKEANEFADAHRRDLVDKAKNIIRGDDDKS